ncbi:MAG: ABC transporter substrate-binding protein [Flavobacterium sp.]|uniref:substrate-binding domain-containing protein n=1 Tax=Flavobacterium sp. TaxID=239 RepID=UPI001212B5BC|nr:substrate-binding domain-containing protein [Flavobacterium sp.]RZJ67309.1 MAG: ABC transporter substrate-binding protein [Flavobacterium sp.]
MKISGVPEHFNLPWRVAIEAGDFEKLGIDAQWIDVPEGTGKLCQMLRSGETDIAVILTEGIIKDINAGNPSRIVQVYVQSPLIWGIHVSANSGYQNLSDIEGTVAAISRKGSGSELMTYVNAQNQGWNKDELKFEIVNTIDGAVEALTNGSADYFMWERFMTKPLVDKGIFRRIADCPTPWPCFVIAVRSDILETQSETIEAILSVINKWTQQFKKLPEIDMDFANRYHLKIDDVRDWLELTEWSQRNLNEPMLNNIQNQLFDLGIITKKGTFADIVHG